MLIKSVSGLNVLNVYNVISYVVASGENNYVDRAIQV